ncbi:MAG: DUF4397 domain-containing protein [Chloroflexota bacterium]
MRTRTLTTALAAVALAVGLIAAPASAIPGSAVTVVHGIPGAKVDVCVGPNPVLTNFRYGQHYQANLPAGTYRFRVRLSGHGPCNGPLVFRQRVDVPAGANVTAVAVVKGGAARLELDVNSMTQITPGYANLSAIHEAKAPAVDIWIAAPLALGGAPAPTVTDVVRGDYVAPVAVPLDAYALWVSVANQVDPVIGPEVADVNEQHAYQAVAIGTKPSTYRRVILDLGPIAP